MAEQAHNPSKAQVRELAALWTQTNLAVRAFVASVVHDTHAVDDILQNVALTIVDKADSFEPGTNFRAWAFAIARQHILAYRKKEARGSLVFDHDMLGQLADAHVELAPEFEDRRDAMRACMEELSHRQRRVLDLEQLKAQRIAEMEGMSQNAVYLVLSRVRTAMLDCIERRLAAEGQPDA